MNYRSYNIVPSCNPSFNRKYSPKILPPSTYSQFINHRLFSETINPSNDKNDRNENKPDSNLNDMLSMISDIQERTKCRHIVDAILLDPRVQLPFNEYLKLCENHSLNEEQARKLSQSLHISGIIWYFDGWFEDQQPLLIKTKELCKAFVSVTDVFSGDFRSKFIDEKNEELKKLLLDIKPLDDMHTEIDLHSRKFLRNCWRGFFAYVVVHCMAIPYLTFWAYSWDIMEPVTYMFNLWTLFLATWFYMNTNFEFSNEGISEAIRRTRREKLYVKYSFDIKLYKYLQERIADIEEDLLNPEWQMLKKVHPSLPDTVRNIHLHPKELFVQYGISEVGEGVEDVESK